MADTGLCHSGADTLREKHEQIDAYLFAVFPSGLVGNIA
jgi:hypothetical protein